MMTRTPSEFIHGHFCHDCAIGDRVIFGWYNEHGIVKIKKQPYCKIGSLYPEWDDYNEI